MKDDPFCRKEVFAEEKALAKTNGLEEAGSCVERQIED